VRYDFIPFSLGGYSKQSALPRPGLSVEEDIPRFFRELPIWSVEVEPEMLCEPGKNDFAQITVGLAPRKNDALKNRDAWIAEDQLFAHFATCAEAAACRAGAEGRIEREVTWLELGQRDSANRTTVALRKQVTRV